MANFTTYLKKNKRIYLMGDSNARLGEYTKDENIHGEFISNGNKNDFKFQNTLPCR